MKPMGGIGVETLWLKANDGSSEQGIRAMAWYRTFLLMAVAAGISGAVMAAQAPAAKPALALPAPVTLTGHTPRPVFALADADLFHGYRCGSDNCALHQQGYQWAADHNVGDANNCHGTSEEFIEGCLAFAGIEGPLGERGFDASFPSVPN